MAEEVTSIGIGMETDGVERGIKSLKMLAEQGPKVEKAMAGIEGAAGKTGKNLDDAGKAGERAAQGLGKVGQAAQSAVSSQAALASAFENFTQVEKKYLQSLVDEFKQLGLNRGERERYIAQSMGMSSAAQEVAKSVGQRIEAYKQEQAELKKLSSASTETTSSMLAMARAGVAGVLGGAVAQNVAQTAAAMYNASAAAERLRISLDFSSVQGGMREIAYLRQVTGDLGLSFASTAQAYQQFSAATRGTALEGEKTREVFESVAEASAVMGLSADKTSGVLLALQQMVSKGTVQAEELRGQLGERLPGAFQIAAKAMGVTTAELGKMLEQGQVIADDFLPKFAKELNASLGNASEKAADRLDAATNRFNNSWERLKQNVGDSGVSSAVAKSANQAAESMNAISIAMEQARAKGTGFWGQIGAGVSVMYDLGNASNRSMVNMYDNAQAIKVAEGTLKSLQNTAATGGDSQWLRVEIKNVENYIARLKDARRERDALTGVNQPEDPRDQSGYTMRGASYRNYAAKQAESEKALIDVRMRALGINKQYFADLKTYQEALAIGVIGENEYVAAVTELANATWKHSAAGKEAEKSLKAVNAEAKKSVTEYQNLVAAIRTKIVQNELEIASGSKLNEADKLRAKLVAELESGSRKLSVARRSEAEAELKRLDASERSLAIYQAQKRFEAERDKENTRIADEITKINQKAQALEDEADVYGKTAEELRILTVGRLNEQKAILMGFDGSQQLIDQLNDEIDAVKRLGRAETNIANLKLGTRVDEIVRAAKAEADAYQDELRLAGLTSLERAKIVAERKIELDYAKKIADVDRSGASEDAKAEAREKLRDSERKEKETAGARAMAQEWQRTADDINRSLTDALMRGFESGKDFAQNFRDTLKNMFSTLVLRPTISAILMPVAGFLATGVAGGASAGQGGVLSTMGSAGGILSGLGAMSGAFAGGMGWLTGATSLGGALGAGGSLITAGGAGVLPGIGMIAGALAPIALGLAGLTSLVRSLDRSGTPHWGAAAEYSGGVLTGGNDVFRRSGTAGTYSAQAQAGVDAVAKGVGDTLEAVARAFGKDGGYSVMTAYSDDSSDDPGFGSLRITRDGQKIRDWEDDRYSKWAPGIFADGEEGWKLYLAAIAKDTRQALTDMDLPGWADKMLTDLGETVTMEQLAAVVQQIGVINTAFEQLGNNMAMFAGITDDLQGALLEAAGGIDALVNSAGAFYQGFYTDAERMDALRGQLNTALSDLDLSIDPNLGSDAKAQFRTAVENAMASGNAELAAALLAISGNFASAADYFEQLSQTAAEAARKAAEDARRSVYDMFKRAADRDRKDLQAQASSLGDAISGISSAVDLLKSNARDLYGEVDSTAQMAAARGMVYVENALAGVRAGASVADYSGLSDAISAARGGLGNGVYQSEFERQRDTLVLAGQLSELGELGDLQLSVEERQLRAINEQLEYLDGLTARADELINGTVTLTGTVESYFQQLIALFDKGGGDGEDKQDGGSGGGGGFAIGGSAPGESAGGSGGGHIETEEEEIRRYYKGIDISDAQSMRNARNTALFMGWTQEDIARAYDVDVEDLRKLFDDFGIPAFATGINRVPYDMVAQIHKDEAIVPAAFNPFNPGAQRFGGGDSALVDELRALRKEVAELRLISAVTASNTAPLPVMADQFDSVTEGGNAMRGDAGNLLEL